MLPQGLRGQGNSLVRKMDPVSTHEGLCLGMLAEAPRQVQDLQPIFLQGQHHTIVLLVQGDVIISRVEKAMIQGLTLPARHVHARRRDEEAS